MEFKKSSFKRPTVRVYGNNKTCIYGLKSPYNGQIKYVGKADDPRERFKQHMYEARRAIKDPNIFRSPKINWLISLAEKGRAPILVILELCPRQNYEEREEWWIDHFLEKNGSIKNTQRAGNREDLNQEYYEENKNWVSAPKKERRMTDRQLLDRPFRATDAANLTNRTETQIYYGLRKGTINAGYHSRRWYISRKTLDQIRAEGGLPGITDKEIIEYWENKLEKWHPTLK